MQVDSSKHVNMHIERISIHWQISHDRLSPSLSFESSAGRPNVFHLMLRENKQSRPKRIVICLLDY